MHFNNGIPKFAVLLLATFAGSLLATRFYSLYVNPQIKFDKSAAEIKQKWAEKLTREYGSKTVIYGGSSCAFSIDGERMLEKHHIPLANYGLGAGDGAAMLTLWAVSALQPHDTLIVALEPGLLTYSSATPAMAYQFSAAINKPSLVDEPWYGRCASPVTKALALRPGGLQTFTYIGKILSGSPPYRYLIKGVNDSGWETTDMRIANLGCPSHGPFLSPDSRAMLKWLRQWCDARQIRLAYSLPWANAPQPVAESFKRSNIEFLLQISEFMPVLKDPKLGADVDQSDFADTPWHLTAKSAPVRTDELAKQLQAWDVWSVDELQAMLKTLPSKNPGS